MWVVLYWRANVVPWLVLWVFCSGRQKTQKIWNENCSGVERPLNWRPFTIKDIHKQAQQAVCHSRAESTRHLPDWAQQSTLSRIANSDDFFFFEFSRHSRRGLPVDLNFDAFLIWFSMLPLLGLWKTFEAFDFVGILLQEMQNRGSAGKIASKRRQPM